MFDAIAPRYDLVNRLMTFRLDVRWRRLAVRSLDLPPGSLVADLASGTGDLCVELAAPGPAADLGRPLLRDAARPTAAARPGLQADILRLPVPGGIARRGDLRLRPAQPRRARRVLRRARPAPSARAGGSPSSTSPRRPTRCCGWGHGVYFGKVVPLHRRPALRSRRLPVPAEERGLPAEPRPRCSGALRQAGFTTVQRRLLSGGITQLVTATRDVNAVGMRAVTRPLDRDVDLNGFARGDGFLFVRDGVGLAGRGVAARVPGGGGAERAGRDRARRRRSGGPGCGPIALGVLPVPPVAPGRSWSSRPSSSARVADGDRWITTIDGAEADLEPPPVTDRPTPVAVQRRARACRSRPTWLRSQPAATRSGPAGSPRSSSPATCWSRPTARSTSTPSSCGCGRRSARATATPSTASSAPPPSCSSPATVTSCARTRSPARRPGPAIRPRTPAPPPRSSPPPRTRSSTGSSSTSCTRRCCRGAATSTGRPSPRSSPWPTCSTWARSIEGRLSSPPPNVLEMVAGALRRRRPSAAIPAPRRLELIAAVEGFERGRYGGAVGWVDAAGNGTWAVAIRCAEIERSRGPAVRRRRHRGRQRSARRAGRDAGQAAGHALGHRPSLSRCSGAGAYWTVELVSSSGMVSQRSHGVIGRTPSG